MSNPTEKEIYDMCAGNVKVNLNAAIKITGCAIRNAKDAMEHAEGEIHRNDYNRKTTQDIYHANHHAQFYAQILAQVTQEYADAWKLYHALTEAKTRETFELIRDESIINREE